MNMPAGRKLALLIEVPILLLLVITATTEAGPEASRRILRWAARRCFAADPVRARFEEEWLADLEDVPGKLAKLAHAVGVLVFTAAPLWARSRWERSRLARWLNGVTSRLGPTPAVINGASGAVLARAGTIALTLAAAGLVTAQYAQSAYRLIQPPDVSSRAAAASGIHALWLLSPLAELPGLGQWAQVPWRPTGSGTVLATRVGRNPVGSTILVYLTSETGKHYLIAARIVRCDDGNVLYLDTTGLTEPKIKSFEVRKGPPLGRPSLCLSSGPSAPHRDFCLPLISYRSEAIVE